MKTVSRAAVRNRNEDENADNEDQIIEAEARVLSLFFKFIEHFSILG